MQHASASDRAAVLERLRAGFGERQGGEFADLDGLSLASLFLRPLPDDGAPAAGSPPDEATTRARLLEFRRQRRIQKRGGGASGAPEPDALADAALPDLAGYGALIADIPRLRDNLAEWLGGVDAEFTPGSSTPEELEALRARTEYRLKALTLMRDETQRELDHLILTLRATCP